MRMILLLLLSILPWVVVVVGQTPLQCLQGLLKYDQDDNDLLEFNEYRAMLQSFAQYYGEKCVLPNEREYARSHFSIVACSCNLYDPSPGHECQCLNEKETVALPVSPPVYPDAYIEYVCELAAEFMKDSVVCENSTVSTPTAVPGSSEKTEVENSSDNSIVVIAGCLGGVAFLLAVLLIWWCRRRNLVQENVKVIPGTNSSSARKATVWDVTNSKPRDARTEREKPEEPTLTGDYDDGVDDRMRVVEEQAEVEEAMSDDSCNHVDSTIKSLEQQYNEASHKANQIIKDNDVRIQSAFKDDDIDLEDPTDDTLGPINLDDGGSFDTSEIVHHHRDAEVESQRKKKKKGPVDMDKMLEETETKNRTRSPRRHKSPTPRSAKTAQIAYQQDKNKRRSGLDAIPEATLTEAPLTEL